MPVTEMLKMVSDGRAINVRTEGKLLQEGTWELRRFLPYRPYCDPVKNQWIQCIGRNVHDNRIYAVFDARFENNPNFECLYVRS